MHTVHTLGYTHCPQFANKPWARAHLREIVKDSLARAKRKSKTARKHKNGPDNYSITLGSDKRSTLWASHWIS